MANERQPKSRQLTPSIMVAVGATLLGVVAVQLFSAADREIFSRLVIAFGDARPDWGAATTAGASHWLSATGASNSLVFLAAASAITTIANALSGPGRILCTTSLFAAALVVEWALWRHLHIEGYPLGLFVALAAGFFGGLIVRAAEERRRETESHYYQLKIKNNELLQARLSLLKQDEIERRILAADLHDQVLNDLKQVAQRFDRYVTEPDNDNADAIRKLTNQVMREIREVMDSLSPSVLEHLGMAAAVEDCLRRGAERSGFKVRFKNNIDSEDIACLSMVEQTLLYRLVQESITNICKHAGASIVRTSMAKEDGNTLLIAITDDGKGIDPQKMQNESRGLKYMRYRADLIGATIGWKPGEKGKGTTVEIRLNLADRAAVQSGTPLSITAISESETEGKLPENTSESESIGYNHARS